MKKQNNIQKERLLTLFNAEAEEAVISAVIAESTAFAFISSILRPEMFYKDQYALIYRAVEALYDKAERIDAISIAEQLRRTGNLDAVGGAFALTELMLKVGSASHIETHALLVQQEYYRRRVYETANKIVNLSSDPTNDIADVIDKAQANIDSIMADAYRKDDNIALSASAYSAFQSYFERERASKQGLTTGIETGVPLLNKLSRGWQNGNLVIIAARPAMGKTSVALHMAKSAASKGFRPVIFSLEMSHTELSNKLILSESDIDPTRFKNGGLSQSEINNMEKGAGIVCSLSMTISDKSDITVRQIKNTAKLLKKQDKCDVVFIDYLQLINCKSDNRNYNRENEVSQTSRALKIMAKELEIPVIVLSQLSRNCEERAKKRPLLSDLRESGAIEQDADVVMFLFRPEYYNIRTYEDKDTKGMLIIDIAKGRNLPTCEIEFAYNEQFTKFFDPNKKLL